MLHSSISLTSLALDLTTGISSQDRFERLLATVRQLFNSEASALLLFQEQKFVPLAIDGLAPDVLGRHFVIDEHPRLEVIARAGDVVRFPADSDLPDPYDGLIPSHTGELEVHACIGLPLTVSDRLIGALTIDGFSPTQFDGFTNDELRTVSALAAASLNNALLMDKLEQQAVQTSSSTPIKTSGVSRVEMIGQSPAMQSLKKEIGIVADTELTTLILGETGTGKELVAAAIHAASPRADFPMVYLNCAALPESVAESELFGHVKGAFTGAISNRKGKFELADQGTLFLDEVGELSLPLQSKLLRVLQYGDLQRVGDDRSLKVNTRIIAATNRDLKQEVMEERFRADLYHRLSVFPVAVPPLRERGNDILQLAGFFIEKCRGQMGIQNLRLSDECHEILMAYHWPGNVRELEHCIHRAAILARSEAEDQFVLILPRHFSSLERGNRDGKSPARELPVTSFMSSVDPSLSLREATDLFQRQMIEKTVDACNGRWAEAARQLSVDAGNLHRLAKRLGLK
ncbi:nitric oxide reductase transcriptional regulator NorR [Endozoicomonadaceae bacterium StTr2]